jgi:shikimate dehydrogenase
VLSLLDEVDGTANSIGAVNTVVNDAGRLTGYNTDVEGARKALEFIKAQPGESVLIMGAGGVARAIVFALRQLGFSHVLVTNRDLKKVKLLNSILPCEAVPWEERYKIGADLLINATSVGMRPDVEQTPMAAEFLGQSRAVMDVVVSPMDTKLIREARSLGLMVAPGHLISLEQAIAQFRLYTGVVPPRALLELKMREFQGK